MPLLRLCWLDFGSFAGYFHMSRYEPLGICIYCGETELPDDVPRFGDEHIIPLALGGNLILPEASCKTCEATINRLIETPISSQEWGYFRSKHNFPTRNKRRRKTHVTLKKYDGGPLQVPIRDYPSPVPLYLLSEARILSGRAASIDPLSWTMKVLTEDRSETEMRAKYPEWDGGHQVKIRVHEFARLIAKIGYGYAVAELGYGAFRPIANDIILGRSDDLFELVGGSFDLEAPIDGGDHLLNIDALFVRAGIALVIVRIRLFSAMNTPIYHAIVGEINLYCPSHRAAFEKHRANGRMKNISPWRS